MGKRFAGRGGFFVLKELILDLDSSVSETYGDQQGSAYNAHFVECTCYHPLFLFNQSGDLERAMLRRGNQHSATFWRRVPLPVIDRYRNYDIPKFFRGDAAFADGGTMDPLARMLPHLDFYLPNAVEAAHQTGQARPQAMIDSYREAGARGCLGIKLGERGALISPRDGEFIKVPAISPPGPVIDTTGAGDCFYGGLLAGMLRGLSPAEAGRLAAAAGAYCMTGLGATTAVRGFGETAQLAGLVS